MHNIVICFVCFFWFSSVSLGLIFLYCSSQISYMSVFHILLEYALAVLPRVSAVNGFLAGIKSNASCTPMKT